MRLNELPVRKIRRAVDLYLEEAYRGAPCPARPAWLDAPDDATAVDVLPHLLDEQDREGTGARCYALRLGNRRYPFMKLRLQEYLFEGEFFFSVDTHDQMFADQADPELARLKAFNRELKCQIEAGWEGAGLPTLMHLKGMTECRPVARQARKGVRILLVDDDPAIQDTIALMLETRGYDVDRADDGDDAVELADPSRHAMVLMDVEMPRMNGDEACARIKEDPLRSELPILLMTAGAVELARASSPDGFLVKPFHADALFTFIDSQIGDRRPTA